MLSLDVVRRVVEGLSLWDARSVQFAHPSFAPLVHEAVAARVACALEASCPPMIHKFLNAPPGFQELVHGDYVCLRSPRDATLQWCRDGVAVVVHLFKGAARVEVRMVDPSVRPAFADLGRALSALGCFSSALTSAGVEVVVFHTRSEVHRPVFEVLSSVATRFVDRHLVSTCPSRTISKSATPHLRLNRHVVSDVYESRT